MRFTLPMVLGAAALAAAFGAQAAANDSKASGDTPGFNELDKDNDGAISRTEAAGNPALAARFKEVDSDGDGKLTRVEYLKTMAKQDFRSLREKAADIIKPGDSDSSAGKSK